MGKKEVKADALSLAIADIFEGEREKRGWSYRTLEEKAGLPRMRGTRAMRGERPSLIDDVLAIADALGLRAANVVAQAEDSLN